jgi:hypothetical protein
MTRGERTGAAGAPALSLALAAAMTLGMGAVPADAAPLPDPIVMMWQVTGEKPAADFATLKSLGVNVVQSFGLARMPQAYVDEYLRAAGNAGLGVIPYVGARKSDAETGCGLSLAGAEFIRRVRSSPAIVAWHSADEPALRGITKECQARLYDDIKALDPARAVLVSVNFTSQADYDEFFAEDSFDILDLHKYVNWKVGKPQRELVRLFEANHKRSYPVIVTLRAFDSPGKFWRLDMRAGSLLTQYRYFFEQARLTPHIGFYGWNLSPNVGLANLPDLRAEFERLMREKVAGGGASSRE